MIISFDFDGTLTNPKVAELAQTLVLKGHEVHIVTSREDPVVKYRNPDWNRDLFDTAHWIEIPYINIHFTNLNPKIVFFKTEPKFDIHIDDQIYEINDIEESLTCKVHGVHFVSEDFKKLLSDLTALGI